MANAADQIAVMTENLHDAGLDDTEIAECLQLVETRQHAALERYLAAYRKKLLDGIHTEEKRLDCLDFFTYALKKSMEEL